MSETLVLLLFLLPFFSSAASSPAIGLDSFLSDGLRRDPAAANDSFASLPSHLKRSLLSPSPPRPLPRLPPPLPRDLRPVSVKLVGPSFASAAPSLLSSFASAAVSSAPFHSVATPHRLALSHALRLDVSPSSAASPLSSRLSDALRSHLDAAASPFHRSSLVSVPYSLVDSIVQQDFHKESPTSAPAFYIYLINLGSLSKPYAYSYDGRDASPAFSKCLGTLWAGKDRYLWIDLAAGPVDYGPALSGDGVLPEFVHIHGSDAKDPSGLDWNVVEQTLKESDLAYKGQSLAFKSYSIKYSECPMCSFAIARSTNSFTSRFLFENYTLIVSEYLDSKRLRQILSDSSEEMHRSAGIGEEDYAKILPVYVFDLDYDKLLLLDRYHQAVAFRDMVVAVRTRSSQTVSDYSCNGRHVITQTRNLERPIIGSVLQSMWGVSPTHLLWSPEHNSTLVDYTWSVGQTPFGPFSDALSLSFVQRDAARRNVLLTTLNFTITSALDVLESMAAHGGDRKLLKKNRYVQFVQRWNLLKFKLDKVVSAMSQLDFDKAMYFLRSSDHDLYAIHTLVYEASQELEASLVCFKDPPFPWASVSLSGCLFLVSFTFMLRGQDI
uniref:DUF7906 domain-containing protein n=1 Tax=Ananas comosus var. bracteatus TaxID=296719 RepID=A0A6V7QQ94_ANACO